MASLADLCDGTPTKRIAVEARQPRECKTTETRANHARGNSRDYWLDGRLPSIGVGEAALLAPRAKIRTSEQSGWPGTEQRAGQAKRSEAGGPILLAHSVAAPPCCCRSCALRVLVRSYRGHCPVFCSRESASNKIQVRYGRVVQMSGPTALSAVTNKNVLVPRFFRV